MSTKEMTVRLIVNGGMFELQIGSLSLQGSTSIEWFPELQSAVENGTVNTDYVDELLKRPRTDIIKGKCR